MRNGSNGSDPLDRIPQLPFVHVSRGRLTDRVERPYQAAITLITAEAGAGKSTLAAEWASQAPMPVAWYAFTGTGAHVPGIATALRAALGHPREPLSEAVDQESLFVEIAAIDCDFCLVLDNCEVAPAAVLADLFDTVARAPDQRLKLIAMGRRLPHVRLGRLRAQGMIREVGTLDLRFTASEAQAALRALVPTGMSDVEAAEIVRTANGWVAGVVLSGQAIRWATEDGIAPDDGHVRNRFLDEYVQQEILDPMAGRAAAFVTAACELPWLDADLCDVALERSDSAQILAGLDERSVFLQHEQTGSGRIRFHPMIGGSFRRLAQATVPQAERLERNHRVAARLVESGELVAAAELVLNSPGAVWATDMIEPVCRELALRSAFDDLSAWMQRIPDTVVSDSPDLAYWRVMTRLVQRKPDGVETLIDEVESRWAATGEPLHAGRANLCRAMHAYQVGRERDAANRLARALELLPEDAVVERMQASSYLARLAFREGRDADAASAARRAEICAARLPLDEQWSWLVIAPDRANGYALRGELHSAVTKYRLMLSEMPPHLADAGIEGSLRCRLISLYIERNELEAARQEYEIVESLIGTPERTWHRDAIVARARLLLAQGHRDEAEQWAADHLRQLRRLPEKTQLVHLLARIWIERAEYPLVESWLADIEGRDYPWVSVFGDINARITALTLDLACGQYSKVASAAEWLADEAAAKHRWSELIPISVRWATALHHLGKGELSRSVLRTAIERGVDGGFVRAFHVPGFDTIGPFADVWAERKEYQSLRRNLQEILRPAVLSGTVMISKRELEVLRLVAEGRSNHQIADTMYISTNTVRNHLVRIGQRLKAHNRQEAVTRARQLGILE